MKKRTTSQDFFTKVDDLVGIEGRTYRITDRGEAPPVDVRVFDAVPEPKHQTAFTFGLSSIDHPEWINSKPELMISVQSEDDAWALCMGEIVRNYRTEELFSYGTILNFRQKIADESEMTLFLIFASSLLLGDDARIQLSDRTIHLVQLYPIHESEAALCEKVGAEEFFFRTDIDFSDVRRPPLQVV